MDDFVFWRGVDAFGTVVARRSAWTCQRRCGRYRAVCEGRDCVQRSRGGSWRLGVFV